MDYPTSGSSVNETAPSTFPFKEFDWFRLNLFRSRSAEDFVEKTSNWQTRPLCRLISSRLYSTSLSVWRLLNEVFNAPGKKEVQN